MTECGTPDAINVVYGVTALDTLEKVFAHNIRKLRGKQTQAEMAERLDMPLRTYQKFEAGNIPQAATRHELALKLGVPETALFLDPELSAPTAAQVCDVLSAALQNPASRALLERVLLTHLPTLARTKSKP